MGITPGRHARDRIVLFMVGAVFTVHLGGASFPLDVALLLISCTLLLTLLGCSGNRPHGAAIAV
jgi:hypothetical protein